MQEVNKAYVLLADLAASMVFLLLVEDLKEVPGGTHDWMYACHGWAILFLQVWFCNNQCYITQICYIHVMLSMLYGVSLVL